MNILFITNHYYPKPDPNAKRITGLAQNLTDLGHNVTVITSGDSSSEEVVKGVSVRKYKSAGEFSKGKLSRGINHVSFLLKSSFFNHDKRKFDFVIATSPSPFNFISGKILSKRTNSKLILDVRDVWPEVFVQTGVANSGSLTYKIFDKISNYAYKHAHAILAVTPGKVELLKSKFPEFSNKIHLVSNGFDLEFLSNKIDEGFASSLEKYINKKNIVYIGNVGLAQNLEPFLYALNRMNDENIYFHILGKGNKLQKLLEYAESIGYKNIVNHGLRNEAEVYTMLKHASFTYVSLISDLLVDSVPTKIFESLAMGVPVLLSASGDSATLVLKSKLGVVTPVSKSSELDERIVEMLECEELFSQNSEYSKSFIIDNYSRREISKSLAQILESLL